MKNDSKSPEDAILTWQDIETIRAVVTHLANLDAAALRKNRTRGDSFFIHFWDIA
jgi:hypothetical protein